MGLYIPNINEKPDYCSECFGFDKENGLCLVVQEDNGDFKYVGLDDPWRPYWCPLQTDEEMMLQSVRPLTSGLAESLGR